MPTLIRNLPAAAATPVTPTWVERTLVFRQPTLGVETADGWCYGTLAVHATLPGNLTKGHKAVTVTHLPTMLAVARLDEPDEAVAQVEWLWEVAGGEFSEAQVDRTRLPVGVVAWLLEHQK